MKRQAIATLLRAGRHDLANLLAYHVTAAKELYYHGTSTVQAKRILSEGFVPNPKRKVWNPESGRLASYDGTYFSRNFMTASSSAQNAAIKFNGRQCVFEVQLETRTGLMDEDNLPGIGHALSRAMHGTRIVGLLYAKATDERSPTGLSERGIEENAKFLASPRAAEMVKKAAEIAVDDFFKTLREEVKPASDKYTKGLRDAAERWAWAMLKGAAEGVDTDDGDTQEMRAAKNDFMRAAGSVAKQRESFMGNNARITTPVTFRGANRILAAVVKARGDDPIGLEYQDRKEYPVYVVYGKPSGTMLSGMKNWASNIKLIPTQLSRIPNVFDPYHKQQQKLAASAESATAFAADFFKRWPKLKQYRSLRMVDKQGSDARHPEARQHGNEVWLFPKFWQLDDKLRDHVLIHEIGHWVQSNRLSGKKFLDAAQKLGVEVWDVAALPFGQFNMDEAFAECFANYYTAKSELKQRYPEWLALVESVL